MTAGGVPPVLRPVLEALAQASDHRDWMSRAAEIDAAYQQLSDVCRAALASDAGTPEQTPRGLRAMTEEEMAACEAVAAPQGEPFFHKLGCPKINGTAAHCTCPPDRETPEQTPAANAPETSTSLVHAAPDAELDRLLIEYARCQVQARYASRSQPEINRLAYAVEYAAAAIHAHVARVTREARGEVVASGEIVNVWTHLGTVEVKVDRLPETDHVNLVRRREKEEG